MTVPLAGTVLSVDRYAAWTLALRVKLVYEFTLFLYNKEQFHGTLGLKIGQNQL